MSYIGNQPEFDIAEHPRFDYLQPNDPTVSINPSQLNANFLNTVSGEVFICIDTTRDSNVWIGSLTGEIS